MGSSLIEQLPPEILHTICSFLDDKNARLLRLSCKTIGVVADCYAFPQLTFFLHPDDFDMLRYFANHDIFAKNVRSLVYITEMLPPRLLSSTKFLARAKQYSKNGMEAMRSSARTTTWTRTTSKLPHQQSNHTDQQLKDIYDEYVEAHEKQTRLLADGEDFTALKDIVPKFSRLRNIIVSADYWFREISVGRTPFGGILAPITNLLEPKACRQVGSVLLPLVGLSPRIEGLWLGEIHWSFFDQLHEPLRFAQMADICCNLTTFNVHIDTGGNPTRDPVPTVVSGCTRTVHQGDIRRLLEAMPKLESLTIGFTLPGGDDGIYPARLEDLISTTTYWQHLKNVEFEILEAPRQDLLDFFNRHSGTLRTIELRNLRLIESSWRVFLPQLKELAENMFLDDILIAGWGMGEAEEHTIASVASEEWFEFENPQDSSTPCLSDDITDYIMWGEGPNPLDSFPDVRPGE